MKIVNVKDMGIAAVENLLKKPAFDQVELNPRIREANKQLFGEDLTAAQIVDRIVGEVRRDGDAAVIKYTKLIDRTEFTPEEFLVTEAEYEAAYEEADPEVVASLKKAAENVRQYHQEQKPNSWMTYRDHGSILGQSVIPLDRVGIYVPGGTAAYPSSVIMNAMPAVVAGVREIIMMVPPKNGKINPYVLVAAKEAGVSKIFKIGGAQAIAAMAFGTETIPRVDKITGPGNIFVTLAKKAVYGHCDIDMLAGPSEILIVADKTADPAYTAADMLSQAEHDMLASSIVITDSAELAGKVAEEAEKQLKKLPREEITRASLDRNGLIIVTEDIMQAVELANVSAPEHMEILTEQPFQLLPYVRHAGAVFLGAYSPEPLGDYFAGPNHVLPTGGTARYYSVLNVETFMKRTSIISYTQAQLDAVSDDVIRLAEAEGLQAHANAVRLRKL
ncbi:histidinol dehydrogenase [Veillonellaceae bacterium WCA-693-APC-5D-A]|uniref:Histidinol dehydrogenase n=4 Tax=Anaerovibrio TaxID=82373 RepID=A0A6I2UM26_9FIRM|nr:histidinol dehydrogenase [Anaerovibrio slackiae]MBQ2410243.1 histidinol dehydrogenase [Selenomonadaceae bacterium]MBQ5733193.1 histidinol dehydrogenase [Selenomonadaceae bacterium]MBR0329697.1 histidinol dehydrogenase [Selenomonadaceae bacterium]MCI6097931.1 histidinol dehydrogenase [Selenomonadaceae bacterium]MCI6483837.1 histidinol dehydrogenase [Selenomonadaceae bacterium]